MPVTRTVGLCLGVSLGAAILLCSSGLHLAYAKPFMIVGSDEKVWWDDDGKTVLSAPGKDTVLIVDLANPEDPKIVATLPLKNSIVGPPVNLDIDPTGAVALVADSVDVTKDGDALKQVPDNKIFVIDLEANPPRLAATITGGKQPSGLSFSPSGKMALVANRGDNSVSVLSVNGTEVKVTDTITFPDSVAHVMFTPDGKRALAVRFPAHKVSVLDINGDKVTYNKIDLPTGQWPYNVVVTPNRHLWVGDGNSMVLVARSSAGAAGLAARLRAQVRALDPEQAVFNVKSLRAVVAESTVAPQVYTTLLGAFGGVALFLSILGIYALISYTVTQRRHEMGVRAALGARLGDLLALVIGEGMTLAAAGIAAGLVLARAAAQAMTSLLFGVQPGDPRIFGATALVLAAAALAASLAPAIRAARVDPTEALRMR